MANTAEGEMFLEGLGVGAKFDLRVPQRFVVKDFEWTAPVGKKFEWDRVIESRKKTELSVPRHRADGDYSIILYPTQPQQGVFAWMLPSIRPLIAYLRKFSSLRKIGGDSDVDDAAWLKALSPEQLSEADWADLNRRIKDRIEDDNKRVKKDLPELWLRFNILRRRILVMQLRPPLNAFIQNRSVAYGPSGESDKGQAARLMAPTDTTNAIMEYDGAVSHPELAPVQTTHSWVGVSCGRRTIRNWKFDAEFYPTDDALDFLSGQKLKQLREGTNSSTKQEASFTDNNQATATPEPQDHDRQHVQSSSGRCWFLYIR